MNRIFPWEHRLGNVVRRAAFPDDAREVLLGAPRRLRTVRATHDRTRELELGRHRVAVGRLVLEDEPVPVWEQLVRDSHRLAELLLRRLRQPYVVPAR